MAKVKIQGHASGTGVLTVTAPNTSTDRTITLPDSTGTLLDNTSITDNGDATSIVIDSSEKVSIGGSGSVTSDSQVAIKGGNLELATAGAKYWIPRASDGVLTGSLYSPSGSVVRLSGAGTSAGTIEFEPRSTNGVIARVTGDGLCFGSDTAAANALDDYEEGSWTPAFIGSSGSAGSVAHSVQEGYYTKIGRLVTCQFNLTLTNRGSWSGEARLTGLPFDPADTFPAAGSVSLDNVNVPDDASGHDVYVNPGVTYFRFYYTQDFASRTFVQVNQVTDAADFNGTISYIV
jgi:hypothetical protein